MEIKDFSCAPATTRAKRDSLIARVVSVSASPVGDARSRIRATKPSKRAQ